MLTKRFDRRQVKRVFALLFLFLFYGAHITLILFGRVQDLPTEGVVFVCSAVALMGGFKVGRFSGATVLRLAGISLLLLGFGWPITLAIKMFFPQLGSQSVSVEGIAFGVVCPGGPELGAGILCVFVDKFLDES